MKRCAKRISTLLTLSLVLSLFIGTSSSALGIFFEYGDSPLSEGDIIDIPSWTTSQEISLKTSRGDYIQFTEYLKDPEDGIFDYHQGDPIYHARFSAGRIMYHVKVEKIEGNCIWLFMYTDSYNDLSTDESEYWLSGVEADILQGITNGESIVYSECDSALSNEIMQSLLKNNIGLDYKFTYEGVAHEVFIPAGKAVDDDTPWYGPLWLLEKYGEYDRNAKHGTYTIVSGDTLNDLAAKFDVTVDYLMEKNPYIKDNHWIYPGNTIEY